MTATNEFEALARQRKVLSLCVAIDAALKDFGIPDASAEALHRVIALDEAGWLNAARVAGCKVPSEITRGLVIDIYKRRVEGVTRVVARSATAHAVVGAL